MTTISNVFLWSMGIGAMFSIFLFFFYGTMLVFDKGMDYLFKPYKIISNFWFIFIIGGLLLLIVNIFIVKPILFSILHFLTSELS